MGERIGHMKWKKSLLLILIIAGVIIMNINLREEQKQAGPVYLILTESKFITALAPLISWRNYDYTVAVETIDGLSDAEITSVIVSHSNAAYVLIVGNKADNLPDSSYVDFNSDGIMDIPIGRFPFSTESKVINLVNKIIAFESAQYYKNRNALFVASSEATPPAPGWRTATYYINDVYPILQGWNKYTEYSCCGYANCDAENNQDGISAINNGVLLVSYQGHGGNQMPMYNCNHDINYWFLAYDISLLNNFNKYPIFVSHGCSTMSLSDTRSTGNVYGWLGIDGMSMANAGFIASVGSLEITGGMWGWGTTFYNKLLTEKTLGLAFMKAGKPASPNDGVLVLLGDPALKINQIDITTYKNNYLSGTSTFSQFITNANLWVTG